MILNKSGKHSRNLSDLNNQQFNKWIRSLTNLNEWFKNQQLQNTDISINPIIEPRRLFKSDTARFLSPEQYKVILACINNTANIFYVNVTGSGKSLVFFNPHFINKYKYTLIFIPLIALKDNLTKRGKELGPDAVI